MGLLTILKPGMQTLLQDPGRVGLAYYAIPCSGPMDPESSDLALTLVGNDSSEPVIECHFVPPQIRFDSAALICLTGADMQWQLDGKPIKRNQTIEVFSGAVLSGLPARDSCRAYLAIRGAIQTERSFGSVATYPLANFGGNKGRPFASGDTLHWSEPTTQAASMRLDLRNRPRSCRIAFVKGPEFDWLSKKSKELILTEPFQITPQSNRMGARLAGPRLSADGQTLAQSVPILPGIVQLLPSGQCVVVLADGQTTGGYPRIGYLVPEALSLFGQWPIDTDFWWEQQS